MDERDYSANVVDNFALIIEHLWRIELLSTCRIEQRLFFNLVAWERELVPIVSITGQLKQINENKI